MNLKDSRLKLIILLYMSEIRNDDLETCSKAFNVMMDKEITDKELTLTEEIKEKLNSIDEVISNNLENYTLSRLNIVDKQIIRLAVYEFMYTDTASAIIIDEAINNSKLLSEIDEFKSSKFNNKLLDKIGHTVRG